MQKESKRLSSGLSPQSIYQNQERVLLCLKDYNSLTEELYQFEELIYDKNYNLPRAFFKHFKCIHEGLQNSFNMLEGFASVNKEFLDEKDRVVQEQMALTQSHISKGKLSSMAESDISRKRVETDYGEKGKKKNGGDSREIEMLKGENQNLRNELRRNDAEYQIEVKKYNLRYEEMLEEIRFYETRMSEVDEHLETIDRLEVQVSVCKQIKDRDQQLIRNMARKIKNFQVQKQGRSGFLSPSRVQTSFLSPSRMSAHVNAPSHISSQYLSPSRVSAHLSPKRYGRY